MNETQQANHEPENTEAKFDSCYLIDLADEIYALPRSSETALSWVQRPQEPTYLPTLPRWCLGLVNVRNIPVLLIDLRMVLGLPARERDDLGDQARHVFVEHAGDTLGLLVERTRRFHSLPVQHMPSDGDFIAATVRADGKTVRVLNLEAIWKYILQALGAPSNHETAA